MHQEHEGDRQRDGASQQYQQRGKEISTLKMHGSDGREDDGMKIPALARRYPKSQSTDAAVRGNFKDKEALAIGRTCLTTCGVEEKKRIEEKRRERKRMRVGDLQIAERKTAARALRGFLRIKTNLWKFSSLQ